MALSDPDVRRVFHFDPAYTTVEFAIRNLWYTVKGRFKDLEGVIVLGETDVSRSSVTAKIKAGSIDTGNKRRDAHLLLRDFFEVEKFPDIEFRSTSIQRGKDRDSLDLEGELIEPPLRGELALAPVVAPLPKTVTGALPGSKGNSGPTWSASTPTWSGRTATSPTSRAPCCARGARRTPRARPAAEPRA